MSSHHEKGKTIEVSLNLEWSVNELREQGGYEEKRLRVGELDEQSLEKKTAVFCRHRFRPLRLGNRRPQRRKNDSAAKVQQVKRSEGHGGCGERGRRRRQKGAEAKRDKN